MQSSALGVRRSMMAVLATFDGSKLASEENQTLRARMGRKHGRRRARAARRKSGALGKGPAPRRSVAGRPSPGAHSHDKRPRDQRTREAVEAAPTALGALWPRRWRGALGAAGGCEGRQGSLRLILCCIFVPITPALARHTVRKRRSAPHRGKVGNRTIRASVGRSCASPRLHLTSDGRPRRA